MRTTLRSCVLLALACTVASAAPSPVTLLLWGDQVGDPDPILLSRLDSLRAIEVAAGREVFRLDLGGSFFGSDLGHATRGLAQADALLLENPDALFLAPSDFLFGKERLDTLLSVAGTRVVVSHVEDGAGSPWRGGSLLLPRVGLTAGFLGVLDPDLFLTGRVELAGDLRLRLPEETLPGAASSLRAEGSDLVIAVARGGAGFAGSLDGALGGIDLLVAPASGSGTADPLRRRGSTWRFSPTLPHDRLWIVRLDPAPEGGWAARAESWHPEGREALPPWDAWRSAHDSLLAARRARLVLTLPRALSTPASAGLVAEALRRSADCDVAFVPGDFVRGGLRAGKVTAGDLWSLLPSPAQAVAVFEIPGPDLFRMVRAQLKAPAGDLYGAGYTSTPDRSATGGPDPVVALDGRPLDRGARYRVCVPAILRDRLREVFGLDPVGVGATWLPGWDRDRVEASAALAVPPAPVRSSR